MNDITELWAGRCDGRLLTVALVGLVEMGWNLIVASREKIPPHERSGNGGWTRPTQRRHRADRLTGGRHRLLGTDRGEGTQRFGTRMAVVTWQVVAST